MREHSSPLTLHQSSCVCFDCPTRCNDTACSQPDTWVQENYIPIRPELHERAQVLNLDPPVLVIDQLIPSDLCDSLREAADESGQLARSRLGGGLSVDESMPVSERRTSSSLLIGNNYSNTPKLLVRSPYSFMFLKCWCSGAGYAYSYHSNTMQRPNGRGIYHSDTSCLFTNLQAQTKAEARKERKGQNLKYSTIIRMAQRHHHPIHSCQMQESIGSTLPLQHHTSADHCIDRSAIPLFCSKVFPCFHLCKKETSQTSRAQKVWRPLPGLSVHASHTDVHLQELGSQIQGIIKGVFQGGRWGPPCTVPKSGSFVFEGLQVAKYEQGEYFLSHEDGFPKPLAEENKFQRRATVLLYLNDVSEGGATLFDWLGVSVKPEKGKALIFFPSFSNGIPDDRTLHGGQDAVDDKWVAQQWVAAACKAEKPVLKNPLSAAAGRAAMMKAGVGRSSKSSLLGKGSKGLPQEGDDGGDVREETVAELKAKASMSKRKRKVNSKQTTSTSKGFGS